MSFNYQENRFKQISPNPHRLFHIYLDQERNEIHKIPKQNKTYLREKLKKEFHFLKQINSTHVVKARDCFDSKNLVSLVEEYIEGETLISFLSKNDLTQKQKSEFALQMTESIVAIQNLGIIHGDITLSNFLVEVKTHRLVLIDFGLSFTHSFFQSHYANSKNFEGSIYYISPEQSGRINKPLELSSDLYSLGICMFYLFAKRFPFDSQDANEIIRAHLMDRAPLVSQFDAEINKSYEQIIEILLAKNSSDRYQSAHALINDLKLININPLQKVELKQKDKKIQFQWPNKIVGRDLELDLIGNFLETQKNDTAKLLVLGGNSGIGKTALISQMQINWESKKNNSIFVHGKFAQFTQSNTKSALILAIEELINYMLTLSRSEALSSAKRLNEELYPNAQILIDFIPQLEQIIGPQPALPTIGPLESQQRFSKVIGLFFKSIRCLGLNIIVFLDDIQWSDFGTLNVVTDIIKLPQLSHLTLFLCYRIEEISLIKPFLENIQSICQNFTREHFLKIELGPLDETTVNSLINDCFLQKGNHNDLANFIFKKSNGVPFFIIELFKVIFENRLIQYNFEQFQWYYNLVEIKKFLGEHEVVDLVIKKLLKYSDSKKLLLSFAAYLGNSIPILTLEALVAIEKAHLLEEINDLVNEGIFAREGIENISFRHDRIQQAASQIDGFKDSLKINYEIGKYYLSKLKTQANDELLIVCANHLREAKAVVSQNHEENQYLEVQYQAAQINAKKYAFIEALKNIDEILNLFPNNSILEKEVEFGLKIYQLKIQAEYALSNFEAIDSIILDIEKKGISLNKYSDLIIYQVHSLLGRGKQVECLDYIMDVLNRMGVKIPRHPSVFTALYYIIKCKIVFKFFPPENFLTRGLNQNENIDKLLNLIEIAAVPSYLNSEKFLFVILNIKIILMCKQHGVHPSLVIAIGAFGLLEIALFKNYKNVYRYSQIYLKLVPTYNIKKYQGRAQYYYTVFNKHWGNPENKVLEEINYARDSSAEYGDTSYASWAQMSCLTIGIMRGYSLDLLWNEYEKNKSILYSNSMSIIYTKSFLQVIHNLRTLSKKADWRIYGEYFNKNDEHILLTTNKYITGSGLLFSLNAFCFFILDNPEKIETIYKEWNKASRASIGGFVNIFYNFFSALCFSYAIKKNRTKYGRKFEKEFKHKHNYFESTLKLNKELFLPYFEVLEAVKIDLYGTGSFFDCLDFLVSAKNKFRSFNDLLGQIVCNIILLDLCMAQKKEFMGLAAFIENNALIKEWGSDYLLSLFNEKYRTYIEKSNPYAFEFLGTKSVTTKKLDAFLPKPISTSMTRTNLHESTKIAQAKEKIGDDYNQLLQTTQFFDRSLNVDQVLLTFAKLVMSYWAVTNLEIILNENGQLIQKLHLESQKQALLGCKSIEMFPTEFPLDIIDTVLKTKKYKVIDEIEKAAPTNIYFEKKEVKSLVAYPLKSGQNILGIFILENSLISHAFTEDRLDLLNFFAAQLSIAVENSILYSTMDQKINVQTQEIQSILRNINLGILHINDFLRILPGYSPVLEKIIDCTEIENHSFIELVVKRINLAHEKKNQISDALKVSIGSEIINFHLNAHLLPQAVEFENNKFLEFDWIPVCDSLGGIVKIMVLIKDVSEIKANQISALKQKQELILTEALIHDKGVRFLRILKSGMAALNSIIKTVNSTETWEKATHEATFRELHSYKGMCRTLKMEVLSDSIHKAEDALMEFELHKDSISKNVLLVLLELTLHEMQSMLTLLNDKLKALYSMQENSTEKETTLLVQKGEFEKAQLVAMGKVFSLDILKKLCHEEAQSLSLQLKKQVPEIDFDHPGFYLKAEVQNTLEFIFIHLIRNSLDHAIVDNGTHRLKIQFASLKDHLMEIKYSDNGKGINLKKLRNSFAPKQNEEPADEDLAELIFKSGVSTAENVSDISGRGVGLEAVKNYVLTAGGEIQLVFTSSKDLEGFRKFQFNISLPVLAFTSQ